MKSSISPIFIFHCLSAFVSPALRGRFIKGCQLSLWVPSPVTGTEGRQRQLSLQRVSTPILLAKCIIPRRLLLGSAPSGASCLLRTPPPPSPWLGKVFPTVQGSHEALKPCVVWLPGVLVFYPIYFFPRSYPRLSCSWLQAVLFLLDPGASTASVVNERETGTLLPVPLHLSQYLSAIITTSVSSQTPPGKPHCFLPPPVPVQHPRHSCCVPNTMLLCFRLLKGGRRSLS